MIEAILCIICNVLILFAFRQIGKRNIPRLPALIVNYLAAFATGILFFFEDLSRVEAMDWWWPVGLGLGFILVFNLMAALTHRIGMGPGSMIIKLSVVIPSVTAIFFYGESPGTWMALGIVIALASLFLTSDTRKGKISMGWLALGVFFGAGSLDALLNHLHYDVADENAYGIFSTLIFLFAALWGGFLATVRGTIGTIKRSSVWMWGIILGIPNFGSVYFLLLALNRSDIPSSGMFPFINVSIVLLSTFVGWILFGERTNTQKAMGILLGIISLVLIAYGGS
ncbi:MAG: EamA family transporter [Bacteroidota bacterium]|nr:EamA family transporter [Bacteroidota bacterium]